MNICILSPTCYPANTRGLEIHVRSLSQELAKLGHTVHLISENTEQVGAFPNLHEHAMPSIKSNFLNAILYSLLAFVSISIINRDKRIDVYHFHGPPHLKLLGEILFKLKRKAVVYTIHGSFTPSLRIRLLFSSFGQNVRIVAVSDDIKRLILSEYPIDNIAVIPTGIHLADFRDIDRQERNGNTILFVGALTEDKGVTYLVECMEDVFKKHSDAKLIIAGDGPMKDELVALSKGVDASNRIEFKGQIPHNDIPALMGRADLLVVPSISIRDSIEGTPTVILEAMASRLPIIATKVGGIPFLIKDGENGSIISERDRITLGREISNYLDKSDLIARIGESNFEKSEQYDWDKIIPRILAIYSEIL